jgi:hypothetical protein
MTDSRVEALAAELVALPLAEMAAAEINRRIADIIGDADRDFAQAALDLAAAIMKQRTAAAAKYAEMLQTIERLAHATNCPDGTNAVTWLQELGLIEPDGAGGYVLTPKAGLRSVK